MENKLIAKDVAQKKLVITWLSLGLLCSLLFVAVSWSRSDDKSFPDAVQ
jgi:hypothetical protein